MFHPELIGLIYAPSLPFPRREYWVFGHSASALNGHLCLLPPLLALWIKYTCHVTLHSTATDLWWSSGGRNCFCVGFQPTKSMSVSIFWTHPENPPPPPSEVRSGWRRQRNKETRPHCTDMEPAAILTRDKGDDYDDVQVVGLTIWQQEICRISEVGIFVVYLKWVYWPRLIVSYSRKTPHAQIAEWQGHKKHALRFTWQSI